MGSDGAALFIVQRRPISIHAPRMGSDPTGSRDINITVYFNPRSPHGERPLNAYATDRSRVFQSTLPAWGATADPGSVYPDSPISIHAPRMGSDVSEIGTMYASPIISIHAPRMGSDLQILDLYTQILRFQSTLPAWGATFREI